MKSISLQPSLFLSSGDPVLDRRLDWGRALLEKGEAGAAADLLRDTLNQSPDFLAGYFLLGEAAECAGDMETAAGAFNRAAALDPEDRLGARLRLARLGVVPIPGAMSETYVRNLFDQYAGRFDKELAGALSYRGPELLRAAVARIAGERRFKHALDLGCGTGLMGEAIRDRVDALTGVDLSPAMIEAARNKKIYDRLAVNGLLEFLSQATNGYDLILAADVFVYLDDLAPVLKAISRVAGGLVAFTIETHPGENVILRETLRYAHGASHLRAAASNANLQVLLLEPASTRTEKGNPVEGLLAVLDSAFNPAGT